ncbi:iron ABC transporter ATP-binding protein [Clostridium carboxidivorans P7]|uniref:ABC transporter related protein n=1 Tax=Clostridium carboxidivorans P7 TaxID=536227 RepID=C6PWB2_9CLOT|nr:ABC transporter ATP-binding protein [Clostridium carboxidivorans]AKN29744.1 iron ABC transporter ATP-binding protein [Clostridium carboxidivorans P7]EET86462.1 ABC transporter related protein [Clostridium carboxidivorans P7]EFG89312.1 putative ferrichrome transport ATP-binding protein FhuC [Clostridium carboxidivorans P7]
MKLEIKNVVCGYGKKDVVNNISMNVSSGEILCLLGPNGVGKTTFFKTILGFLKLKGGEILVDGKNIHSCSRKQLAKIIGYVPQSHTPPFPFKVFDVVLMGRTAHLSMFSSPSKEDRKIVERALEDLKIDYLRDKIYTEISGGERQMVLIARALAQDPKILIMDEPTSNLDFGNQIRVLEQINKLSERGLAIIMTSHYPNHAFLCSTKVAFMQKSNVFTVGTVDEVVTEDNLKEAYGINVKIINTVNSNGNKIKACIPMIN